MDVLWFQPHLTGHRYLIVRHTYWLFTTIFYSTLFYTFYIFYTVLQSLIVGCRALTGSLSDWLSLNSEATKSAHFPPSAISRFSASSLLSGNTSRTLNPEPWTHRTLNITKRKNHAVGFLSNQEPWFIKAGTMNLYFKLREPYHYKSRGMNFACVNQQTWDLPL